MFVFAIRRRFCVRPPPTFRRRRVWIGGAILLVGAFCLWIFTFQDAGIWFAPDSTPLVSPWMNSRESRLDIQLAYQDFNLTYRLQQPRNPKLCDGVRVLIFVLTRPSGFETRQTIRKSWANVETLPSDYMVRYIVGAQSDYETEVELQLEQQTQNDLVRYDARDSYRDLFVKTHALLSWQRRFCPQSRWLVKADDDAQLNFTAIDRRLRSDFESIAAHEPYGLYCEKIHDARPYRFLFSRWHVSRKVYEPDVFPDYCPGTGYMMTTPTVSRLLNEMISTQFLNMEDVYFTGILSHRLGIPIHDTSLLFPIK